MLTPIDKGFTTKAPKHQEARSLNLEQQQSENEIDQAGGNSPVCFEVLVFR